MKKLVITCALLGSSTSKKMTPHVPITPEEVAEDCIKVVKAGASVLHIHARDAEGNNSAETDRMVLYVTKIREALKANNLDAIINITSSGRGFSEDLRLAPLPILLPEMCSFDPGTMNWGFKTMFMNTPEFLERLGQLTLEHDIKPELEIFDGGMMGAVDHYVKVGLLKEPVHYQFVLGVPGAMPGNMDSLNYLVPKMRPGSTWSVTGIGTSHLPVMLMGLACGCDNVRVGLEDNLYMDKGVLATNEDLVKRAVELAKLCNREIANAAEAREILHISRGSSVL